MPACPRRLARARPRQVSPPQVDSACPAGPPPAKPDRRSSSTTNGAAQPDKPARGAAIHVHPTSQPQPSPTCPINAARVVPIHPSPHRLPAPCQARSSAFHPDYACRNVSLPDRTRRLSPPPQHRAAQSGPTFRLESFPYQPNPTCHISPIHSGPSRPDSSSLIPSRPFVPGQTDYPHRVSPAHLSSAQEDP